MTLITDYTLSTYNAYTDVAGMDAAIEKIAGVSNVSFWPSLTTDEKENLICIASFNVGKETWKGTADTAIIAPDMYWPRDGVMYKNGVSVASGTIPVELLLYMACWISKNYYSPSSTSGTTTITAGAVKSKKVGDVSVTYETNADLIAAQTTAASGGSDDSCSSYVSSFISSISTSVGGVGAMRKCRF